jgi:hypothetical protein
MPGLDPGIHDPRRSQPRVVDCRVEPGNDVNHANASLH